MKNIFFSICQLPTADCRLPLSVFRLPSSVFRLLSTFYFLLFTVNHSFSQSQSNLDLANQYFTTGEYEKAAVYYEKQYNADPFGTYEPYLKCLILLKDYDKAEKLIKKQVKKNQ